MTSLLLLLLAWAQAFAGNLTVEVLDVGQGDSILLTTPAGKTVLIDAGTGNPDVVPMLRARGVTKLDLVVATHAHADHIGGMDEVLEAVPVKLYGDQGLPHTTATYEKVMQLVEAKGVQYLTLRAGRSFSLDDGIKLEVLAPEEPLFRNPRSDLNSNSVITRLTHGQNCFLFAGDAEDETEVFLMRKQLGPCKVLKVAHHGSEHSTSVAWLKAVQPEIALISVGRSNRYGHPTPETLGRLERSGAKIYRTDLLGTLRATSDGKTVKVEPFKEEVEHAGEAFVALQPVAPAAVPAPVASAAAARTGAPPVVSTDGFIDLNTAGLAELELLPGIGPSKAAEILRWREEHGPFRSMQDLDAVPGIGPATLEKLEGQVRFGP